MRGVFGEWMAIPDWFRDVIEGVEDVNPLPPTKKPASNKQPSSIHKKLVEGNLTIFVVALFCLVPFVLFTLQQPEENLDAPPTPTVPIATVVVTEPPPSPTRTASPLPSETAVPTASATPLPTETATATAAPVTQARILAAAANLRDGPGTDFAVIGSLAANDRVELLEQTADGFWYQVRLADGSVGWIGSTVAEIEQSAPLESDE